MGLSFTKHIGDGSTTSFIFSFEGPDNGYYDADQIKVYVNSGLVPTVLSGPTQVTISPAPSTNAKILIRREVTKDQPFSDYQVGNVFGKTSLNNSFRQALFNTHETMDGFKYDGYEEQQDLNLGSNKLVNLAPGESDTDAVTIGQMGEYESNAAASATAAASSASSSASSASDSLTYATASSSFADSSASSAASSASSASDSANSATASASSANSSFSSAENASESEDNALVYATAALEQATLANSSATAAATSETNAANSASAASSSAAASASSASDSDSSATASHNSAISSALSANDAETSENNAAVSETNAANSASAASTSEINASTSETNAASSASAASSSAASASASASAASTSESNAASSASAASLSESNASTSATNAAQSATDASGSATAAAASATQAAGQAAAATSSATDSLGYRDEAEDFSIAAAQSASIAGPRLTIGIIGDSLSVDYAYRDSWPYRLKKLCDSLGFLVEIKNYAIGGATFLTSRTLNTQESATRTQAEQCIAQGADIVFVMLGINDSFYGDASFATSLTNALNLYSVLKNGLPSAQIILVEEITWDFDNKGGYSPTGLTNNDVVPVGHQLITYNSYSNCRVNNSTYLSTAANSTYTARASTLGDLYETLHSYYDGYINLPYYKVLRLGLTSDGIHFNTYGHNLVAMNILKWLATNNGVDNNILNNYYISNPTYFTDISAYFDYVETNNQVSVDTVCRYQDFNQWERYNNWMFYSVALSGTITPSEGISSDVNLQMSLRNGLPNKAVILSFDSLSVPIGAYTDENGYYDTTLIPNTFGVSTAPGSHTFALGYETAPGQYDIYEKTVIFNTDPSPNNDPGDYYFERHGILSDNQTNSTSNGFITMYLSSEVADPKGVVSSGGFTAPFSGFYSLTAFGAFTGVESTVNGSVGLVFAINGVAGSHRVEHHVYDGVNTGNIMSFNLSQCLHLSAGDQVVPRIEKWGGGSLTMLGDRCSFSGHAVSFN